MTHTKDEALKLALEALKLIRRQLKSWDEGDKAIAVIKQALAAPVPGQGCELYEQMIESVRKLLSASKEPERWGCVGPSAEDKAWQEVFATASHVCTGIDSPPAAQPAPVPLTDEQITAISKQVAEGGPEDSIDRFVRAIEAAHGITKGGAA